MDIIRHLPKVDLHYHLDGSISPTTLIEIASEENIKLPTFNLQELTRYIQAGESCKSLKDYLTKFHIPQMCMQTATALRKIAYSAIADVAKHNVKYMEVRIAPYLHTKNGLTIEEVVSGVLDGLIRAEKEFGIIARVILICLRDHPIQKNMEVIKTAGKFLNDGVVGVDLAGNEANYPPLMSRQVFELAKNYNIPITIHAGEAAGVKNIYDSIISLGATRIGHGIRLKDDPELVKLIKDRGITLEMCPTSNIQTKSVDSWKEHPFREYYNKGILVTVNTDNTTVSNTNITREYKILVEKYSFSFADLKKITYNAVNASFINDDVKTKIREVIKEEYYQLKL